MTSTVKRGSIGSASPLRFAKGLTQLAGWFK